ncbi:hypothetical protein [Candidatus Hamiltonella defensa]|nr:hypothetical protein [Candidatus Hamiltonella defensa]
MKWRPYDQHQTTPSPKLIDRRRRMNAKKDANSDGPSGVEKKGKDWKHSGGKSEKGGLF